MQTAATPSKTMLLFVFRGCRAPQTEPHPPDFIVGANFVRPLGRQIALASNVGRGLAPAVSNTRQCGTGHRKRSAKGASRAVDNRPYQKDRKTRFGVYRTG